MTEPETKTINPQITDVDVGIRTLRKIKIYPLAVGDQLKMTQLIEEALKAFFKVEEGSEESLNVFMGFVIDLIKKNLEAILKLVALDESDDSDLFSEISNMQMSEIAKEIYIANFSEPSKNVMSLFEGSQSLLERLLQLFARRTAPTDLSISSPETLKTEESPSGS